MILNFNFYNFKLKIIINEMQRKQKRQLQKNTGNIQREIRRIEQQRAKAQKALKKLVAKGKPYGQNVKRLANMIAKQNKQLEQYGKLVHKT